MRRGGVLSHKLIVAVGAVIVAAAVAVVVTFAGTARVSETAAPSSRPAVTQEQTAPNAAKIRAALTAALTFSPPPGATAVAPDAPIVVKARAGRLASVRVTSSNGSPVPGGLSRAADQWQSSGSLAYGSAYRVVATVAGANVQAESTAMFSTLTPPAGVSASVFPDDGLAVGVGQPVVFRFSQSIDPSARASLLMHLSVTASRPIVGGWYWFSDRELHYRPQTFWPTGESVSVVWDLTGWDAGGGAWGEGGGTVHFTIGHSRVSYANLTTHLMTVTDNGRTIGTYPISGGKPTDPTMDGVHIVLDRESVVRMISSSNGIPVNSPDGYDELVYNDVHISDTGEYVHAAPWSVSSQGHMNVSHGCINLSPANAQAFFAFSRVGDVVVVTGSPRPPVTGDHGVMDWDTAWSAFTRANVFVPTPATLPTL